MDAFLFQRRYADWKNRAEELDRLLQPVVNREIDINAPNWEQQLKDSPHPADETNLRLRIKSLFHEIIDRFEKLDAPQRQVIIDLMDKCSSLLYSAVIEADMKTEAGFRKNLILFVIADQGKDTRDAILDLNYYRERGHELGFDVDTLFKQMADIASDRDKYGWGSTRDLFLKY